MAKVGAGPWRVWVVGVVGQSRSESWTDPALLSVMPPGLCFSAPVQVLRQCLCDGALLMCKVRVRTHRPAFLRSFYSWTPWAFAPR